MSAQNRSQNMQTFTTEISLVHLNSCFVNLPPSLCSLLTDINALTQNVVVELNYHTYSPGSSLSKDSYHSRSIYVGWTGLQSKQKLAPTIPKDSVNGIQGSASIKDQPAPVVELDSTFARAVNLLDGQKVTASLHLDPPVAHTINIEPLTPEDWEIIELHATFLELNLIAQIRALPNPNYIPLNSSKPLSHPLTLKLSPTSSANIIVTSLLPELSSNSPFARLGPDAEVIVAPKTRAKPPRPYAESRSVTSRRSAGGRKKILREESRIAIHCRGFDRSLIDDCFEDEEDSEAHSLKVWIDRDLLTSKALKGKNWVLVTVLKPASLQPPVDPRKQPQEIDNLGAAGQIASKVVARLLPWDSPSDSTAVVLSKSLCVTMECKGILGGIVKLEPVPLPLTKAPTSTKNDHELTEDMTKPKSIKIYPFSFESNRASKPLKIGGDTQNEKEEITRQVTKMYNFQGASESLLNGPITDGLILGKSGLLSKFPGWEGGILRFDNVLAESEKQTCQWFLGSEHEFSIEIRETIPRPTSVSLFDNVGDPPLTKAPNLVGIDKLLEQIRSNLLRMSSVLLTGAQGSGKSVLAQLLAYHLRKDTLFHTTYFSCRKIISDETRVFALKEIFDRVFRTALWCSNLGGKSVVILDDLDKLCPVETELETSENGRSRQISEILCAIVKQFCTRDSGIIILATAQAKQSLHNVLIGGHIFREIAALKAPNKEERRHLLETIVKQKLDGDESIGLHDSQPEDKIDRPLSSDNKIRETFKAQSDDTKFEGHAKLVRAQQSGFIISPDIDFLDLAGETDGYMPEDLVLLVTRARSEALIRVFTDDSQKEDLRTVEIRHEDFGSAIKGFIPTSLRNITLQTSTTTFDTIGGLYSTRKTLLETLQYPTTYSPIFDQCPLRLRSGLLLYGYPGCGKTLLASAVAGECGLNFISVKGPEILNKYIGASEKSVRDLFERAEAAKPCILFFDEFDSIAPKRGHDSTGVTDRVVNQLLTQMDGAEGLSGVYVLAATSRPDLIDPALLRPGRLDKSLLCDLPDRQDRIDILSALGKKLKLSQDVVDNFGVIASHTEGFSGADLQALIYNANLEAIHDFLNYQEELERRKAANYKSQRASPRTTDPIKFLFSEERDRLEIEARSKSGLCKSKLLAERAAILAIQAKVKAQERRKKSETVDDDPDKNEKETNWKEKQEVVIEWYHMSKSLSTMKPSISALERKRLANIYREFLTARDGEVRDGDGGREVGGRVSLM